MVESYVLSAWLPLSTDDSIEIDVRNIIVMSKPKESLSDNYTKFIETLAEEKKEIENDSSNEKSETDIKDLIDRLINNTENEDQNDNILTKHTRSGKTIH
jgi:antitoxin component of MazEF toxin-antitoxin module